MLSVTRLKEFVVEVKATIPSINFVEMVADDSQLIKFLEERKPTDNNLFIAVLPQFNINGDEDKAKWNNMLMFFVLAKYSKKDIKNTDEYMDIFGTTQATALEFVNYLLSEKSGDNGELCGIANELIENSISVTPVWEKAQCNGWMIEIDLATKA